MNKALRSWIGIVFVLIATLLSALAWRESWPMWVSGTCVLIAFGCLYYVLAGMAVLAIFIRAVLALLPIGAGAGAIIYVVLTNPALQLDPAETRTLVAAIVVAAGWMVTFVTGELRQINQEQERRRDTIRAALTEIQQIIAATTPTNWDEIAESIRAKFHQDRRYEIFVMYSQQFKVLKRLVEQVEILHKAQIEPVMALYQLLDRIEEIESRMGCDAFKALHWSRRQDAALKYIELQKKVPTAANKAETALKNAPFWGVLRRLR